MLFTCLANTNNTYLLSRPKPCLGCTCFTEQIDDPLKFLTATLYYFEAVN